MRITFATQLTLLRMVALPFIAIFFIYHEIQWVFWLFTLAALTDFLDGIVARFFRQQTGLGAVLDPLADKLLINTCYFMMTYMADRLTVQVPAWLTVLVLSRDFLLLISALLLAVFVQMRRFHPTFLGKCAVACQAITIFGVLVAEAYHLHIPGLPIAYGVTFALTLGSGLQYAWRGLQWLNHPPVPEPGTDPSRDGS